MTPDDKRRLAEIDEVLSSDPRILGTSAVNFLRRMLDEATAERDAAMAALRETRTLLRAFVNPETDDIARAVFKRGDEALAAHSAATKPTDLVENESNNAKS